MTNKPLSSRDLENLSAYLDAQMTPNERRRLEAQLAGSPALQTALDELRQTRQMLRSLPRLKAPRNFTLKPEMVQARRPRPLFSWGAFSFSAASALAALLLFVFFIGDFTGYFTPTDLAFKTASQPAEAQSPAAQALATSMVEIGQQAAAEQAAATEAVAMLAPQFDPANTGMGGGGGDDPLATPQPGISADISPFAKNMDPTVAMTGTDTLTTTLALAPLNVVETQPVPETYAEPVLEYFPAETPAASNQIVFTPLWVRLVEAALLLMVLGAGLWAVILFRRNS